MENSDIVGTYLLENLNKLRTKYDFIGDVRGKGMFMAVEFVESQSTNKALPNYHLNAIVERFKVSKFETTNINLSL